MRGLLIDNDGMLGAAAQGGRPICKARSVGVLLDRPR